MGSRDYVTRRTVAAAPATNTAWIYATGTVKMWRSEVEFIARDAGELLRRNTNETFLIAEQWFMLGWDCCHFAILVDLPITVT